MIMVTGVNMTMISKGIVLGWHRDFECPGGDCGLTCCHKDWQIRLKDDEIEYYRNLDHEYRDKIIESIDADKKVFKCDNGKCNLLTDEGYCNIVLNCGADKLCNTCKTFPRISKSFGDIMECGVEIVCPLVAENLFDEKEIDFDFCDFEVSQIEPIDYNIYDSLAKMRASVVSMMQLELGTRELLPGKMYIMLNMYQQVLDLYKKSELSPASVSEILDKFCSQDKMVQYFLECSKLGDLIDEKISVITNILLNTIKTGIMAELCTQWSEAYPKLKESIETWMNNPEIFRNDIVEFMDYMRNNYPYFTEKYFAYIWFMDGVSLKPEEYERKICSRTMEHLLINIAAMSVYKNGGCSISKKEFAVVVAAIDRYISHARRVQNDLMDMFNELKAASMINLLLMIIC